MKSKVMDMATEHTGMLRMYLPREELVGINFQKVHEDGTPESIRFPSKF